MAKAREVRGVDRVVIRDGDAIVAGIAARIAIGLGQNDAGQIQRFVEGPRGIHRVLAGHAVHDKQCFSWRDSLVKEFDLPHHFLVNVQATSSIQDHHICQ